uniref:Heme/hemopexin utilization protein C n=1 Tax=Lygus hesperus TaxID=30085 RepID=A0A0A9XR00_LYGHE
MNLFCQPICDKITGSRSLLKPSIQSDHLCTSTNTTPHEMMFNHPRRSPHGTSIPTWLSTPGPVLMSRHVMGSKYEPSVIQVDLLEANPDYSYVGLPDGRETTVTKRHLAPMAELEMIVDPC